MTATPHRRTIMRRSPFVIPRRINLPTNLRWCAERQKVITSKSFGFAFAVHPGAVVGLDNPGAPDEGTFDGRVVWYYLCVAFGHFQAANAFLCDDGNKHGGKLTDWRRGYTGDDVVFGGAGTACTRVAL